MQDEQAAEQDVLGVPAPARVLHSDPHDFAGLYIRHRASFTLHARRYLRDGRDADEVVQEAFLRLFLALPELETELQALAYCRRTITNLCIDRYRAQARRPSLVDLDSAGALDLAEDDPGDPVVRAEDAATVRAALSLLSPLHRAALVKREIEEKPLPVIAEELEIPEESVKHVLFRARRALRRILASTSLAPGSDDEISGALGKAMRSSSGGVAAFLMLLVLGLGTGPDLRAIPVVGTDLPELIPVTGIVSAVGGAVTSVAGGVAAVVTSASGTGGPAEVEGDAAGGELPLVPAVLPSPTATPTAGTSPAASPSAAPTPSVSGAPSPTALPTPTVVPSEPAEVKPVAEPSRPASQPPVAPSTAPTSEPTSGPSPSGADASSEPRPSEPRKSGKKASPAATPTASPVATKRPVDPDSYQTEGLEYAYDPDTGTMVLVPVGETYTSWRN